MLEKFELLKDKDVKGKTVILRADLNSPIKHGVPMRSPKIRAHAKTMRLLCEKGAKVIALSHQGRKGKPDFVSLKGHLQVLEGLKLGRIKKFHFCTWDEDYTAKAKALQEGEVLLLENTRFLDSEKAKVTPEEHAKTDWIKNLASAADLFVLDALSVAHRDHASVVGFTPLLPSYAGYFLEEELTALQKVEEIRDNTCLILGGAKPDEPIEIMNKMLSENRANSVLLGGILGELGILAKGKKLGAKEKFLEEKELMQFVPKFKELIEKYPDKIFTPKDVALIKRDKRREIPVDELPSDYETYDVGHHTITNYGEHIDKADLIIYNGPFGKFEDVTFSIGTREILDEIKDAKGFSLIGGGDTVAALIRLGFRKEDFGYISLAGGALLEFLTGKELPGLKALEKKK